MKFLLILAVVCVVSVCGRQPVDASVGAETLCGQVVCSECWFEQKDRKASPYGTPADLKCAARCSKDDIPQALAVWNGNAVTLYHLEKGTVPLADKDFLSFASKEVEITGTTRLEGDRHVLRVDTLKITQDVAPPASSSAEPAIGSEAPALALRDLTGQEQSLAGYRGKIVVLNFWATWCLPCRKEMPAFVSLQNAYAAWGVQVIAASADAADREAQVVRFVRDQKLAFPIWLGATPEQMLALGLGNELPGTIILDRDGKIVARFRGTVTEAQLKKEVDALLEKQRLARGLAKADRQVASSVPS